MTNSSETKLTGRNVTNSKLGFGYQEKPSDIASARTRQNSNIGLTQLDFGKQRIYSTESSNRSIPREDTQVVDVRKSGSSLTVQHLKQLERQAVLETMIDEEEELIEERNKLVNKMFFEGGLTKYEDRRFKYISWQLDRIDDAKNGVNLDKIEAVIKLQKKLASQLEQLQQFIPKPSKHRAGWKK